MESLYRKYRPLTFESVVGQQHIVSTLEHAVCEGRLSHAYLFCGPRGTGKTTMARILAKSLLCEGAEEARAQGGSGCMPDGTCPECTAIAEGTHPDVYELDAASRTGVDNVREEIISSVNFAPVRGAFKIYIIDEVHMLTTQAFNALLKTLEEPPAHVVFVLCTTDPQKIPETILSRCQRFDFHRIGNADIVGRLAYICEQEGFAYDAETLEIVAKHARGGMRDALSTLEQLSVFGNGSVQAADARSLLGEVSGAVLEQFSEAVAERDVARLFGLVRTQVDEGNDLMELTRDLVAHIRDVYMVRVAGARPELFEGGTADVDVLAREAELFGSADRLARALTVLDDAALEMRSAADTRLVLEIALTRLARPETDLTLEALVERIERLEARLASGVPASPLDAAGLQSLAGGAAATATKAAPVAEPTPAPAPAPKPAAVEAAPAAVPAPAAEPEPMPAPAVAAPKPAASASAAPASAPAPAATPRPVETPAPAPAPAVAPAQKAPAAAVHDAPASAPTAPAPVPASVPPASAASVAAAAGPTTPAVTDQGELQRKWQEVVRRVVAAKPSCGALLQSARATADDGAALTVSFPAGSNFAMMMVARPDTQSVVLPQVTSVFGGRSVRYVMDDAPASAPAKPAASAPVAPASAPAPAPVAAAPAPTVPAPAPAPAQTAPAAAAPEAVAPQASPAPEPTPAPVPAAPEPAPAVDQTSGPTFIPEPGDIDEQRRAWEEEQVPYDDAAIAAYEEDDLPPFDMPAPEPAPVAQPASAPAPAAPVASAPSTPPAPAPASEPAPAPQQEPASTPAAAKPEPAAPKPEPATPAPKPAPSSADGGLMGVDMAPAEMKSVLDSVFGDGVIYKNR